MKYIMQILTLVLAVCLSSCKKSQIHSIPLTAISVTNAVIGGKTVKFNTLLRDSVIYGNYQQFALAAGNASVYVYPVGDSLKPYYQSSIQTSNGSIYSLFLSGQAPNINAILIQDNIPYRTDSTTGIRFINLSPNSSPVNITLSTSAGVSEFAGIAYKQITEFKTYPGLSNNKSYIFQIRDAATNALLVTYTLVTPRFKNVTLALRGLSGTTGTTSLTITRVNHY